MTITEGKTGQGLLNFFGDAEVVQQFKDLTNPEQMIEFMWKSAAFQNCLKLSSEQVFGKSDGDTRRFRELGNKQFKIGKDKEAIKMFNKAVTKAPVNDAGIGKDLSLAIANRSAALLKLGFFSLALNDIEFAFASGYPRDLRYKLHERKIKIFVNLQDKNSALETHDDFLVAITDSTLDKDKKHKLMNEIEVLLESKKNQTSNITCTMEELDNTKLDHKVAASHPSLPCLSADVGIEFAPTRGRFAVANKDIPTGSVILVEPAVVNVTKEEHLERFCDFCFKCIDLRLIPCKYCSYVGYCSKSCSEAALDSYHKYECGNMDIFGSIMDNIYKDKKDHAKTTKDLTRLSFRGVVQKSLSWYKENKTVISAKMFDSNDESYEKSPQLNMLNLVSHCDKMTTEKRIWMLISSVFHLRTLQISGYFGQQKLKAPTNLTADELYIGGLLVHVLQLIQFNAHGITECTDPIEPEKRFAIKDYENKTRLVGNSLHPTLCLFNHSCDNNTHKYFAGRTIVIIASKNICKGDEITEGYYPSVQCIPRPQRRTFLSEQFWFDCGCTACTLNQPSLQEVSQHPQNFCCRKEECKGIQVQDTGKCPACGVTVDVDKSKDEIEKIKKTLQSLRNKMLEIEERKDSMDTYLKTTETWTRLQKLVKHPYKLLYTTEQLFWKALRLSHGNVAYWD